jgi:hypothetical protein
MDCQGKKSHWPPRSTFSVRRFLFLLLVFSLAQALERVSGEKENNVER